MKKSQTTFKSTFVFFLSLVLIVSCSETEIVPEEKIQSVQETPVDPYSDRYGEKIDAQPFEINFELSDANEGGYLLQVNVDIVEGSFILSYYAGNDFSGRFLITLEDNNYLSLQEASVTEHPAPVEETYFWADNKEIKKLKGDVTYNQKLSLKTEDDFEVNGFVTFTVEPSCGFYKTDFSISRKSGKTEVTKIGTILNPADEK